MPQSLTQKAVNNFVRGLITESAELTFPEGASVDELNCDLRRDGTRRRRLGVKYEESNVLSSYTLTTTHVTATGTWTNVGGNSDLEFFVVQTGNMLRFYNKASTPFSNQLVGSVNIAGYGSNTELNKCQFTSTKGVLVVTSPTLNTGYIRYDTSFPNLFAFYQITFNVRDYEWQEDNITDYFDAVSTSNLDVTRLYDTYNAGWGEDNNGHSGQDAYQHYVAGTSNAPPLTHPWFSGKNSSDIQSNSDFAKIGGGKTLIGNGRYILDFFAKNRSAAYRGDTGSFLPSPSIGVEYESSRFVTSETFSGRVFYAGLSSEKNSGKILFSRLLDTESDLGKCYQQNDPTAEYASDLLADDGGVINIPDAVKIQKLYTFQNSLFIFAENGIWQITGVDGVFRATEFSVNRVSRIGILQPQTFVEAEGIPFWWSKFGIHTLSTDPVSGQGAEQNLTIPTIQSFWDDISTTAKSKVTAVYDSIHKRIYWGYPNDSESIEAKINNFLVLDVPLRSFFPWKVSDQTSSTDSIVGLTFYDTYFPTNTGDPAILLVCRDGGTGKITFGKFEGTNFLDWGDSNYTSFAVTGYDFIGDLITKKSAPYLVTYCRLTETGFTGNETAGYEAIRPSSLNVSVAWDFAEDFSAGQEVYRLKYPLFPNSSDLSIVDYPEDVITSRIKFRGHGRSMRIKYESVQGKDFLLLGWGMVQGRNPRF